MSDARERAERVLADADRRTEQITALQHKRLSAVLGAHEDVIRRLEGVRGVIGEVLVQDRDLGDPASDVDPSPLPLAGEALDPRTMQLPPRQSSPPGSQQPVHRAPAQSAGHAASPHTPAIAAPASAPWGPEAAEAVPPASLYEQHGSADIGASPQPAPSVAPGPVMSGYASPAESQQGAGSWETSAAGPIALGGITPGPIMPGDTRVGFVATPPAPEDRGAPDGPAPGQPLPGTGWPIAPTAAPAGQPGELPEGFLGTPSPVGAPAGPAQQPEFPTVAMSAPSAPAEAHQERAAVPPPHEHYGTTSLGTGVSGVAWATHLLPAAGTQVPVQAPGPAQPIPVAAASEAEPAPGEQPEEATTPKATARRAAPRTPRARKAVEHVGGDDGTHGGDGSA